MLIKAKHTIIRKYDVDIWNFLYTRKRKNKFFTYFKLSIINKIQRLYRKKFYYLNNLKLIKTKFYTKLFHNLNNISTKYINYRKFFKRSKYYVKFVFFKLIPFKKNKLDILLGVKSPYQRYKLKKRRPLSRLRVHLKQLLCFIITLILKN